jgi:DNA-binding response OmpR family regulator
VIGESLAVSRKQATILLMSSDQVVLQVLKEVLESQGYVVLPAADLAGGVDWLSRTSPDLLIIRPYLRGIAGHDATLYLRVKSPGMRVLMVDGFLQDDRLRYRSSLHTIEVFPPPFTAADFIKKVSDVLASRPGATDAEDKEQVVHEHNG